MACAVILHTLEALKFRHSCGPLFFVIVGIVFTSSSFSQHMHFHFRSLFFKCISLSITFLEIVSLMQRMVQSSHFLSLITFLSMNFVNLFVSAAYTWSVSHKRNISKSKECLEKYLTENWCYCCVQQVLFICFLKHHTI